VGETDNRWRGVNLAGWRLNVFGDGAGAIGTCTTTVGPVVVASLAAAALTPVGFTFSE